MATNFCYDTARVPFKHQLNCGSCAAFAVTGTIECHYWVFKKELLNLSEQEILNCSGNKYFCLGSTIPELFEYIRMNGIGLAQDTPYQGEVQECFPTRRANIRFIQAIKVSLTEDAIKNALRNHGPLAAALIVDGAFDDYTHGILEPPAKSYGKLGGHAMVLVGYGVENGIKYWKFRNSWGPNEGENGYVRIRIQSGNARPSHYQITSAYYPEFDWSGDRNSYRDEL